MSRRRRRTVAWLGIVIVVFAQFATAHAWILPVHGIGPAVAGGIAHHGNCGGGDENSAPRAPEGNTCKLQCSDAAPSAVAPDLPVADLGSMPIVVAPAALPAVTRTLGRSFLAADIAAPPLSLFCRLLN